MKKLLSFIFVLFLVLPGVVWLADLELDCNVARSGYERPKFSGKVLLDGKFYRAFDRYFNDRFSLQGPLLLAKRWIEYQIFRTTDADQVHVGRNRWLYHRKSVEDYRIDAADLKTELARSVMTLHALEAMLTAAGREFVLMVVPNKSSVYPEHLGIVCRNDPGKQRFYERFLQTVADYPLKGFVRLDDRLQEAKLQGGPALYFRDSRFWSEGGAAVALDQLLRKLEKEPPAARAQTGPNRRFPPDDLRRRLMGISLVENDEALRRFTAAEDADLPAAVVYGDGFFDALLPDLVPLHRSMDVLPNDRIPSVQFEETLSDYDLVLLEVAESQLKSLQIDVSEIYHSLAPDLGNPDIQTVDPAMIRPGSGTSLRRAGEGWALRAAGVNSTLTIEGLPGSNGKVFRMLKFDVSAHQSARWVVEFPGELPYRAHETLHAGISEFFVPLPFGASVSLILKPGQRPGLFSLNSVEIVSFGMRPEFAPPAAATAAVVSVSGADRDPWMVAHRSPNAGRPATEPVPIGNGRQSDRQTATEVSTGDAAETVVENRTEPVQSDSQPSVRETAMDPIPQKPDPPRSEQSRKLRPASLHLTGFADGRIFQRIGNRADITVSGQYQGEPGAVEARVLHWGPEQTEVLPWTEIDPKPQNGMFLGLLPQVPQGGWYRLQVRCRANPARVVQGQNRWGVGLLVACIGQSNMKEWFRTGEDLRPHPLLRKFGPAGWETFQRSGNGAISFGNRIAERLGIPVGVMDFAVDGSGLRREADWGVGYWQDTAPGSIYQNFLDGIADSGGALEFVVWTQGEADAARGTVTEKEYRYSLENFIQRQVRADVRNASAKPQLPFLIVSMIKRPYGKDEPHQGIRNAQRQAAEDLAGCYFAATTLDLENLGKEHLAPAAYITLGQRVAQTVLYVLGLETYYRGPEVAAAVQVDAATIDVKIRHRGGSDFQPRSGASGWEVMAGGEPVQVATVTKRDSETLRLALDRPLQETASIRYLFGALPDARRPIRDNSALRLPLEAYQGLVRMEAANDEPLAKK